ncbi:hypothetical protein, partial [Streptomyces clavuligerus]|uniref:hypothetical protein n=1 Tax=Streptomyces clavuligerus TaxID=1901 RepID=UPI001E3C6D04
MSWTGAGATARSAECVRAYGTGVVQGLGHDPVVVPLHEQPAPRRADDLRRTGLRGGQGGVDGGTEPGANGHVISQNGGIPGTVRDACDIGAGVRPAEHAG